jgi:hypothetical protein
VKYEIVEMQQLCGGQSKVYSVILEGEEITLFEKFVDEYELKFKNEVKDIVARLYQIGHITGARSSFFKQHEGKPGDFVCALYDLPEKNLRLFCVRFGMDVVILGGGGEKPEGVIAWQDDEKLTMEATQVISIANDIAQRLENGDIYWSDDHTELLGNMKNYEDEEN